MSQKSIKSFFTSPSATKKKELAAVPKPESPLREKNDKVPVKQKEENVKGRDDAEDKDVCMPESNNVEEATSKRKKKGRLVIESDEESGSEDMNNVSISEDKNKVEELNSTPTQKKESVHNSNLESPNGKDNVLTTKAVESPYTVERRKTAPRPNKKKRKLDVDNVESTTNAMPVCSDTKKLKTRELETTTDQKDEAMDVEDDSGKVDSCSFSKAVESKASSEDEKPADVEMAVQGKDSEKEASAAKKSSPAKESEVVKQEKSQQDEKVVKEESSSKQSPAKASATDTTESKSKPVHSFFAPKQAKKADPKASTANTHKQQTKDKKVTKPATMASFFTSSSSAKNEEKGGCSDVSYEPTKANYHPIDDACWARGQKVPYLAVAKTLEGIEDVSSRLRMIEILSNLLRSVIVLTPEDLVRVLYLCLNKLAPAYEGLELGLGDMLLMKAIAQATGRSVEKIKIDAKEKGDLGIVAETSRGTQRTMFNPPKLTVQAVFSKLKQIATMSGNAVQNKKVDLIKSMFVACRQSEARYLIRSLGGKLRIGLAEQSVLQALGLACTLTPPAQGEQFPPDVLQANKGVAAEVFKKKVEEATLIIKTTYCECPNYDAICVALLKEGVAALPDHCKLTPGVPLKPMLAHPTKGVHEVFSRFDKADFTCEYKYDGERAQIHLLENGSVHIYSRNSEDNSTKYPDIVKRLPKSLAADTKSAVIDSEAVAYDLEKKQILPFQILSTRKRKDANISDIKVQVCVYAFDLLYLNGRSLVKEPLRERQKLLREAFTEVEGEFVFATRMNSTDTDDIAEFLEESIKGNCEGLMVKTLDVDASYEIAKRSHSWLKLKKDYLDGVGDTLDVVVMGAFHGTGKRTGRYGGFLLGIYDDSNEEYTTICKIGTGFKDSDLEAHSTFFKPHAQSSPRSYYRYDKSVEPDVWFEPIQVWEIKCADLSVSPVHTAAAGLVDPEKGISLRFPRFLRIRDDKKPEDSTTPQQVADLYRSQQVIANQNQNNEVAEEDFY